MHTCNVTRHTLNPHYEFVFADGFRVAAFAMEDWTMTQLLSSPLTCLPAPAPLTPGKPA